MTLLLSLLVPALAAHPDPESDAADVETIIVEKAEQETSAAETQLDAADVAATPGRSADSVLRGVRGLHMSAHGGRGKAFQYFLRGFDAVHGADLAIDLEGVPLNEVSNVHGHGYLDLHFIPRRLLTGARFTPGPVDASVGDFGIAGAGSLELGMADPGLQVELTGGTDRGGSLALGYRPEGADSGTFLWADAEAGAGVGMARDWRQIRVGGGLSGEVGSMNLRGFALGYDGAFASPGVLRADDVADGRMGFYDAYPGSGGGRSQRLMVGVAADGRIGRMGVEGTVWASGRRLSLEQNYTGYYEQPDTGDGSLQTHEALSFGTRLVLSGQAGHHLDLRAGVDTRVDRLMQSESGIGPDGAVFEERLDVVATPVGIGGWTEAEWKPKRWLRVVPGLRAQVFGASLDRRLDFGLGTGKAAAYAPVLAPRGRIVLFPDEVVSGYVRAGRGVRSAEARGLESGRAPVAIADSVEASARWAPDAGELRGGAFATWVSNEIVFDHTAARFETGGSTRRVGVFGGATARPVDALQIELDVTASDGRYTASDEPIPYAPRVLVVSQVRTDALVTGPLVWNAGVRTWWLSPRPLPGGFATTAPCVTDLTAQAVHRNWSFDLDIDNVLGAKWRDGEFQYASDWNPADDRVSALPERHFTAGAPFAVRFGIGWRGL